MPNIEWKPDHSAQKAQVGDYEARLRGDDGAVELEVYETEEDEEDQAIRRQLEGGYFVQGMLPSEAIAKSIAIGALVLLDEERQKEESEDKT